MMNINVIGSDFGRHFGYSITYEIALNEPSTTNFVLTFDNLQLTKFNDTESPVKSPTAACLELFQSCPGLPLRLSSPTKELSLLAFFPTGLPTTESINTVKLKRTPRVTNKAANNDFLHKSSIHQASDIKRVASVPFHRWSG